MTRPRVLVVFKKSAFQVYAMERKDRKVRALLRRNAQSVQRMTSSHAAHEDSLSLVVAALEEAGCLVRQVYRAHMRRVTNVDLIVTVGGDGTLLDASHKVEDVPMLGVNSNPGTSVGFLTAANARTFPEVLERVLAGREKPLQLTRMDVSINGKSLGVPVLNDALFCHANPAATSRYAVHHGAKHEEHKSSGLWIATAAGSTAAMASAGGAVEPITARRLQFQVREPYAPPGTSVKLTHGFVGPSSVLRLESFMRDGAVFLDGSHLRFKVGMGDVVEVKAHAHPLQVFHAPSRPS